MKPKQLHFLAMLCIGTSNTIHSSQINRVRITQEATDDLDKKLSEAILNYDLYLVRKYMRDGANVNAKGEPCEFTPLIQAVLFDRSGVSYASIVKELIDAHAHLDMKETKFGNTALIIAMNGEKAHLVKMLLQAGANPCIKNKSGKTVFDIAQDKPTIKKILDEFLEEHKKALRSVAQKVLESGLPQAESFAEEISEQTAEELHKRKVWPKTTREQMAERASLSTEQRSTGGMARHYRAGQLQINFDLLRPKKSS